MDNHLYLFEPDSSLVLRTGRPADQMGDPQTHLFPLPSTTAGAWRTCYGDQHGYDYTPEQQAELKNMSVRGPIAARVTANEHGHTVDAMFPKPADALYMLAGESVSLLKLEPDASPLTGAYSDLPEELCPVVSPRLSQAKPQKGKAWWHTSSMMDWLQGDTIDPMDENHGWDGPVLDSRTHTQVDPSHGSATEGQLFQTQNAEFSSQQITHPDKQHLGWHTRRYGFLLKTSAPLLGLPAQQRVGAEGRTARVSRVTQWPQPTSALLATLNSANSIRVVLSTPGLFANGYLPAWLKKKDGRLVGCPPSVPSLKLRLRSVCNEAWQPLSGWDIAKRQSKPVRRMVPAGAVYWFDIMEKGETDIAELWLNSICDDPADRNDGFGLALLGLWEKKS